MRVTTPELVARPLAAALLIAGLAAYPAGAATPVVSLTAKPDGVEVVFTFPHRVTFGLERAGDMVLLRFTGAGAVPSADGDGRNLAGVHGGMNRALLELLPGARIRSGQQGNRVLLDVSGPPGGRPAPSVAVVKPAAPDPAQPVIPLPPPPVAVAAPAVEPVVQTPLPAPAATQVVASTPSPVAATPAELPPGVSGTAALLPFGSRVGAAAFRRGGAVWIVFDERRPIDMAALQDDRLLAQATVQMLTSATLLRMKLPPDSEVRLTHVADGWTVAALPSAAPNTPIPVVAKANRFELPVGDIGQVVVVPDPDTGQNLLVGTLRQGQGGVPVARRVPAFVLQATFQGVLVEPIADSTTLRTMTDGFVLQSGGEPLSAPPDAVQALAESAFLTRRFEIPSGPPDMLMRRLHAEVAEAGAAPAQTRAKPRKMAAATLIGLGLGLEAQAMLNLATSEDPRLADDPETTGLIAVAEMLGGRAQDTAGINDPALNGSDEVALWRAVRAALVHEGAPEAAPVFASTVKLILAYPDPLSHALLPLAVETMALGGTPEAADAMLQRLPDDPALEYARAIRLEAKGSDSAALVKYDALAVGRDRLTGARSAARATLLRLHTHAIDAGEAAMQLEHQFLNWRGDERELDLRLHAAALRTEAGAWRPAFDLLKETAAMYPDSAAMIQARMADLMTALLGGPAGAAISPLELVALTEENAELVATVAPAKAAGLLADKLLALDLPHRAGPVIERMMRAAPVGAGQASLGATLAALRLGDGDDAGAQAALMESNAPDLPPEVIERRALVAARLAAHAGQTGRATAMLASVGTAAADDLRATLLADAQDWRGSAAALTDLVEKTVPPAGALTPPQQDTLLRLASALSRGGDDTGLRSLAAREGARFDGPRSGMFRLLTAAPVSNVTDLRRSAAELSLAKAIPGGVAAVGAR